MLTTPTQVPDLPDVRRTLRQLQRMRQRLRGEVDLNALVERCHRIGSNVYVAPWGRIVPGPLPDQHRRGVPLGSTGSCPGAPRRLVAKRWGIAGWRQDTGCRVFGARTPLDCQGRPSATTPSLGPGAGELGHSCRFARYWQTGRLVGNTRDSSSDGGPDPGRPPVCPFGRSFPRKDAPGFVTGRKGWLNHIPQNRDRLSGLEPLCQFGRAFFDDISVVADDGCDNW